MHAVAMDYGRARTTVRLGRRYPVFLTSVGICASILTGISHSSFDTGTYVPDPTDTSGYNSDKQGIAFVTFDSTSGSSGSATPRIFVGVGTNTSSNLFMSNDAGSTCEYAILWTTLWFSVVLGSALPGTNSSWMPHKGVLSPAEHSLYISTSDGSGPYDGTLVRELEWYGLYIGTMKFMFVFRVPSTSTTLRPAPCPTSRLSLGVTCTSALGTFSIQRKYFVPTVSDQSSQWPRRRLAKAGNGHGSSAQLLVARW